MQSPFSYLDAIFFATTTAALLLRRTREAKKSDIAKLAWSTRVYTNLKKICLIAIDIPTDSSDSRLGI